MNDVTNINMEYLLTSIGYQDASDYDKIGATLSVFDIPYRKTKTTIVTDSWRFVFTEEKKELKETLPVSSN